LVVAATAGLVLIAIYGPRPSGPAPTPSDTFTHVDMKLAGAHFALTPDTVPAGLVEITQPGTAKRPAKTWLETLRVLGRHSLNSGVGMTVDVVVPKLKAPSEPSTVITLNVGSQGITAPHRDVRREQPYLASFASNAPSDDRAWTAVAPGQYRVVVHNASGQGTTCLGRSIGAGAHATLALTLAPNGPDGSHTYVVTCTGPKTTQQFDLWVL
jgi:hypothetical protein